MTATAALQHQPPPSYAPLLYLILRLVHQDPRYRSSCRRSFSLSRSLLAYSTHGGGGGSGREGGESGKESACEADCVASLDERRALTAFPRSLASSAGGRQQQQQQQRQSLSIGSCSRSSVRQQQPREAVARSRSSRSPLALSLPLTHTHSPDAAAVGL